jgi:hydroxylamine dehydrogenase
MAAGVNARFEPKTFDNPKAGGEQPEYMQSHLYKPESAVVGRFSAEECIDCHLNETPNIVKAFQRGAMGKPGVQNREVSEEAGMEKISCINCHGSDHQELRMPTRDTCDTCHPTQYEQFMKSRHSIAWARATACGRWSDHETVDQDFIEVMCGQCHSIEYRCDSCHARHDFSLVEARKPDTCGICHMGPDHPQIEMYETSRHGIKYLTEGDAWNFTGSISEFEGRGPLPAPVCITCHMPQGTHDVSYGIAYGPVGGDMVWMDLDHKPVGEEELKQRREDMIKVCKQCHSERFAKSRLEIADKVHKAAKDVLLEAKHIIQGLEEEGLIEPKTSERPQYEWYYVPRAEGKLVLGGPQLTRDTSGIERTFFKLYKYDYIKAYKGAYHFNPDYTHWYGWVEENLALIDIQDKARALRKAAANERAVQEASTKAENANAKAEAALRAKAPAERGICGPTAIAAIAVLPVVLYGLLRRRR